MTTVLREVPSDFWLFQFCTDENTTVQNLFETLGQTIPDTMLPSLCNALEILMCSRNTQYVSSQHHENNVNFGHLEKICQTLTSIHHHYTLLFIPACVDAEKKLKQTIIQVLTTARNAHVKLMAVSHPEIFLRAETNNLNTSVVSVGGEKKQSLLKR